MPVVDRFVAEPTDDEDLEPEHSTRDIARALRARLPVSDQAFDRFLPDPLRCVSGTHWTPVVVAARAAQWFDRLGVRTVVDIGSGAGKLCVVGALAGHCRYIGMEHRTWLVDAARDLARTFELDKRVSFVHGVFGDLPTPDAEAYYFYNPFGENLLDHRHHLDEAQELGDARYARDVAAAEEFLRNAAIGTYLLLYCGFGGRIPLDYWEVAVDRELPNVLRLLRKTTVTRAGRPR